MSDFVYDKIMDVNAFLLKAQLRFGRKPWSLSKAIKKNAKDLTKFISAYEQSLCMYAHTHGCHTVIAGHTHSAIDKNVTLNGNGKVIRYLNCGNWVEDTTAIEEDMVGNLTLVNLGE